MDNFPFELSLLGKRIVLKSAGDPELSREVVELVSRKLSEAESRSREQLPHHIALLALLDLAEAHVRARRRVADHQRQLDEKSQELLSLIEESGL